MNTLITYLTFKQFSDALKQRIHHYRMRSIVRNMLVLDDHTLDDIGLNPEEVEWAAGLPLNKNATLALHNFAHARCTGRLHPKMHTSYEDLSSEVGGGKISVSGHTVPSEQGLEIANAKHSNAGSVII